MTTAQYILKQVQQYGTHAVYSVCKRDTKAAFKLAEQGLVNIKRIDSDARFSTYVLTLKGGK